MISYPNHAPSDLDLTLPGWPVLHNGKPPAFTPQLLGDVAEGARLRLSYRNITDAEALEYLYAHRASAGGFFSLDPLPASVAAGIEDAALADRILAPVGCVWTFAGPPEMERVKPGRSNVSVELVLELRS